MDADQTEPLTKGMKGKMVKSAMFSNYLPKSKNEALVTYNDVMIQILIVFGRPLRNFIFCPIEY